jgi:chromosome segregation ATPase
MAANGGGRVTTTDTVYTDLSANTESDVHQTATNIVSTNVEPVALLTDLLNCDNLHENDDFVYLFTKDTLVNTNNQDSASVNPSDSQSPDCNESVSNQSDIENLDEHLQNLPRDLYISKLLELCSSCESMVSQYRNALCLRARSISDCPKGNLMNRKSTKQSSCAERYARDCYTLNMFINGEKSGIEHVFDKHKNTSCSTDASKVKRIETRVVLQTLLERISELEKSLSFYVKEMKSLRSDHNELKSKYDRMEAEATSRFSKYDSFNKLANDRLKQGESDLQEIQNQNHKTNEGIKRVSKVTQNIQKQIQSMTLNPVKSYASVTGQGQTIGTKPCNPSKKQNNRLCENVSEISTQHSNAVEDDTVEDDSIINIRQTVTPSVTPDIPVTDRNESSHMEEHTHKKSTCTTSMIDATDQPCNYTKESERIQSTARALGRQSDVRKSDTRHVLNTSRGGSLINNRDEDIFEGVSYKRNARYYIAGIGPRSTQNGLVNFLKDREISVTHCVFFKQKHPGSRRNAKINVSLRDAQTIESPGFWPNGISCRRWLSNKQWEIKIANEQEQDNAFTGNANQDCDVD